jgi:hypothetical protein
MAAPTLQITAATREAWLTKYNAEIATPAADYADEVRRAKELLAKVKTGLVWTETGQEAHIGKVKWDKESVAVAAGDTPLTEADLAKRRRNAIIVVVAAAVVLVILGFFVMPKGKPNNPAATSAAEATQLADFVPPETVDDSNLRLPVDVPRTLEIAQVAYQVLSGKVSKSGQLSYPEMAGAQGVWFPSPVNWVVGLPEQTVTSLQVGDAIVARTIAGRALRFVVFTIEDVAPQTNELLAQRRAGLTLFPLPSSSANVRVVYARFDAALDEVEAPAAAGIGTPVPVEDGQFVVTDVEVAQQPAGGLYSVWVSGRAAVGLVAPRLEVDGQPYPALTDGLQENFRAEFVVPGLGSAQFVVGGARVELGALPVPTLAAAITDMRVVNGGQTLEVDVVLTALHGTAQFQASDAALQLPSTPAYEQPLENAPLEMSPSGPVAVSPGTPTNVTLRFSWLPALTSTRLRLLNTLYQVLATGG